jgi:hypothetical protein
VAAQGQVYRLDDSQTGTSDVGQQRHETYAQTGTHKTADHVVVVSAVADFGSNPAAAQARSKASDPALPCRVAIHAASANSARCVVDD